MIKPEQIPDEVVKKALAEYRSQKSSGFSLGLMMRETELIRYTIAEAINVWPGAVQEQAVFTMDDDCLILPLPQEKNDD